MRLRRECQIASFADGDAADFAFGCNPSCTSYPTPTPSASIRGGAIGSSQDHIRWPVIVRSIPAVPMRRMDLRRQSILPSTATATGSIDPHGLAALARALVGHAGGAPGWGCDLVAFCAMGFRLSSGQRCQHCDRAKQFESSHVILQRADPSHGLSRSKTCVGDPLFRNA